jgi:hypothetical protein
MGKYFRLLFSYKLILKSKEFRKSYSVFQQRDRKSLENFYEF